jgi:tripartite-type tricarboxylate transporter receptor subunit TctC
MTRALQTPEVSAKLADAGLLVVANTPEQFAAQQKSEYEKRGQLIKAIGIQPE